MDLMLAVTIAVLGLLGATFSKILADEFKAWAPCIAKNILRAAVTRLPTDLKERLSEEWLADMDATPGDLGKLLFALGCNVAAIRIKYPSVSHVLPSVSYIGAKRALDVTIASLALVCLCPFLAMIVLAIRLDSEGPALFRQRRLGFDGKIFDILRFRSMRWDEGKVSGIAMMEDRITRVGKFIRHTHLDELPNFINVLRGEMSIVGPRALPVTYVERYLGKFEDSTWRYSVKPGITGWSQVNQLRDLPESEADLEHRITHDKWYIQNRGLWLDLKILLLTIGSIFRKN
jgi:lipopolysaccharide/colanic/teichoic acid biosynthesis glycosyltransferase